MKISEIVKYPEGRRLEFKEKLPASSDLAKTIVAFANDAGGELYIGIRNDPRELVGIPEEELMQLEEKISNIIYNQCHPVIVPEITFHGEDSERIIRVRIFRGSHFPYYLTSKGKIQGTYVRVGSSNRLADMDIIAELERQRRNISFDSEPVAEHSPEELDIEPFKSFYQEKTGEVADHVTLMKLGLIKEFQGTVRPVNALVLFSENPLRNTYFPYSKIECARFKGQTSEFFIDRKTFDGNISVQAEEAYDFVLRHINKGAAVMGVYTQTRWQYPVIAIREAIRNAVVHRDYSLTGKDIKVAIYDDMIEITSPGKLLPSINFNEMDARQSDIRNKVIAPVFKKLGIIDQWGNGLKLIARELKDYPEIAFRWTETGMQFQIQFIIRDLDKFASEGPWPRPYLRPELGPHLGPELRPELGPELGPELEQELIQETLYSTILKLVADKPLTTRELATALGQKTISGYLKRILKKLYTDKLIEHTIPYTPNHPAQSHRITASGRMFLLYMAQRRKGQNT